MSLSRGGFELNEIWERQILGLREARIPKQVPLERTKGPRTIGPGRAIREDPRGYGGRWIKRRGVMVPAGQPTEHKTVGIHRSTGELDLSGGSEDYLGHQGIVHIHHGGAPEGRVDGRRESSRVHIQHPHDPNTHKTLRALLSMDPGLKHYTVHSDAGHHGSVGSFLRKYSKGPSPESQLPVSLYHGTTDKHHDQISRQGLRPRGRTGKAASGETSGMESIASQKDKVYLGHLGYARTMANRAASERGGKPVVYKATVHDHARLHSDEEWQRKYDQHVRMGRRKPAEQSWWQSLRNYGSVAFHGRIPAAHMTRLHPKRSS